MKKQKKSFMIMMQAYLLLVVYGLQFLAGMILNLFANINSHHPGVKGNNYFIGGLSAVIWAISFKGGFALAIHVYLAILLVLGTIGLVISSIKLRSKSWIICSVASFLTTTGAFFNGMSFINYGHNFSSMIMASCWLTAVSAIVIALVTSKSTYNNTD